MAKKKIDHSKRAHALLSASGAHRWMECTPSARFEEEFPQQSSSVYAEEGTLAHEFGDIGLKYRAKQLTKSQYDKQLKILRAHQLYTDEMEEQVDKYINYVWDTFLDYEFGVKAKGEKPILNIEQKFDLRDWIKEGFGTNDASVIGNDHIHIIDLKYGKGISVSAEDNKQLKLYALGALKANKEIAKKVKWVVLVIVQPRMNSISEFKISKKELFAWGNDIVKTKAELAFKGEGEFVAGDHCKFCRAKAKCKALFNFCIDEAKLEFADEAITKPSNVVSDEDLLTVYSHTKLIQDWLSEVGKNLLDRAINGEQFEGYKLVEGQARRKITDPKGAEETLEMLGYLRSETHKESMRGIGGLEKLLKKDFMKVLGGFIEAPRTSPSLVKESVNRKEYTGTAKDDFKEELPK